mgnify:CR=1 FL=1
MSNINRGLIELRGQDSIKFLQGQVTCDLHQLSDDKVIRGCHCTPKGRVIFLFAAMAKGNDCIVLETHPSIVDTAMASLKKYAVFFKTEISEIGAPANHQPPSDLERLRTGSADITAETSDLFIPQMINLDAQGYISFKKGCYTGQEIIARAHYRGAVKRRMHHLQIAASQIPKLGSEVLGAEGRAIGTVASAAQVDAATVELLAVLADKSSDCTEIELDGQLCAVTHLSLPYEIPTGP